RHLGRKRAVSPIPPCLGRNRQARTERLELGSDRRRLVVERLPAPFHAGDLAAGRLRVRPELYRELLQAIFELSLGKAELREGGTIQSAAGRSRRPLATGWRGGSGGAGARGCSGGRDTGRGLAMGGGAGTGVGTGGCGVFERSGEPTSQQHEEQGSRPCGHEQGKRDGEPESERDPGDDRASSERSDPGRVRIRAPANRGGRLRTRRRRGRLVRFLASPAFAQRRGALLEFALQPEFLGQKLTTPVLLEIAPLFELRANLLRAHFDRLQP